MKNITILWLSVFLLVGMTFGILLNYRTSSAEVSEKADKVLVFKSKRKMHLLRNNQIFKTYEISLGEHPVGHKEREGDERTPIGVYTLDWRNNKSTCYKSLHISYPNQADKKRAQQLGVSPGGSIMIHGILNGWGWIGQFHTQKDWTNGCIAVTNEEIDEIWQSVKNGTPIEIQE